MPSEKTYLIDVGAVKKKCTKSCDKAMDELHRLVAMDLDANFKAMLKLSLLPVRVAAVDVHK